jgi:hypothetical protein
MYYSNIVLYSLIMTQVSDKVPGPVVEEVVYIKIICRHNLRMISRRKIAIYVHIQGERRIFLKERVCVCVCVC